MVDGKLIFFFFSPPELAEIFSQYIEFVVQTDDYQVIHFLNISSLKVIIFYFFLKHIDGVSKFLSL